MDIEPDWNAHAYMLSETVENRKRSVLTAFVVHMLGLGICADTEVHIWQQLCVHPCAQPMHACSTGAVGVSQVDCEHLSSRDSESCIMGHAQHASLFVSWSLTAVCCMLCLSPPSLARV